MSRMTEYLQKRCDIMEILSRLNDKYPDEAKELERRNSSRGGSGTKCDMCPLHGCHYDSDYDNVTRD